MPQEQPAEVASVAPTVQQYLAELEHQTWGKARLLAKKVSIQLSQRSIKSLGERGVSELANRAQPIGQVTQPV